MKCRYFIVFACILTGYARPVTACPFEALARKTPLLSKDHDHWDNWIYHDPASGLFYLYAQAYPRFDRPVTDTERKEGVKIRRYTSPDGVHWTYAGSPSTPPGTRAWSGNRWKEHLYFTEVDGNYRQSLVRIREDAPGNSYEKVLEPTEGAGYHLGEGDGAISAWRDPFPLEVGNRVHLLFAGKSEGNPIRPAVGHARQREDGTFELLPPMTPPGTFTQIELPNVVKMGDRYLLLTSTTHRVNEEQPIEEVTPALRAYWGPTLRGPWKPHDGDTANVPIPGYTYGFNLVRNLPSDAGLFVSGFYMPPHPKGYNLTPVLPLKVRGDKVELEY